MSNCTPATAWIFCESLHDTTRKTRDLVEIVFAEGAEIFFSGPFGLTRAGHFDLSTVFATRGTPILDKVSDPASRRVLPHFQRSFRQSYSLKVLFTSDLTISCVLLCDDWKMIEVLW